MEQRRAHMAKSVRLQFANRIFVAEHESVIGLSVFAADIREKSFTSCRWRSVCLLENIGAIGGFGIDALELRHFPTTSIDS